jgi:hypothetical protein
MIKIGPRPDRIFLGYLKTGYERFLSDPSSSLFTAILLFDKLNKYNLRVVK